MSGAGSSNSLAIGAVLGGLTFMLMQRPQEKKKKPQRETTAAPKLPLHYFQRTFETIKDVFPTALTNEDLISNVKVSLEKYGFGNDVLVATSLCCDELNRHLETELSKMYDNYFAMGGLAGFAFGGVTAFGAMASHIPDGGSCIIVYGPHVGVDVDGVVGTVSRRGRQKGGTCCGSAIAAAGYVKNVMDGYCQEIAPPEDAIDAQQVYVCNMLLPYARRVHSAKDPMAELPFALFEAQDKLMRQIVSRACGTVAGNGKIALLGGIQINTPSGMPDYFMPMCFDVLNNKAERIDSIIEAPSKAAISKIQEVFPTAMPNYGLIDMVVKSLSSYGYGKTTLLATSLCCDELNRPLEEDFQDVYGEHFRMGGLAGFAFGGLTAFGAMAAHIPDNGSCIIVYGPHVGVDSDGAVGTVSRRGRQVGGVCCGSGIAAAAHVKKIVNGTAERSNVPAEPIDAQQAYVSNMLLPYAKRLECAEDPMVELPLALYDAQDKLIQDILAKGRRGVPNSGKIALLGGIQINTPGGVSDHFLPLRFEIINNQGQILVDFLQNKKRFSKTV